jgi:hypothetical protein
MLHQLQAEIIILVRIGDKNIQWAIGLRHALLVHSRVERFFVNRRDMPQDIVVINPQSSSRAKS